MTPEKFQGLPNQLHLACGALVMLTHNLKPEVGLANGSTGTVVDIQYHPDADPEKDLPYCVWVDVKDY